MNERNLLSLIAHSFDNIQLDKFSKQQFRKKS